MDVDAIPLGVNFLTVLREEVGECDLLLALIGRDWSAISDDEGARRFDNPVDFVRVEIATALQRGISVVPVLMDGARMPNTNELPTDLQELPFRNGISVHHASFHTDMGRLVDGIRRSWKPPATTIVAPAVPRVTVPTGLPTNIAAKRLFPRSRNLIGIIVSMLLGLALGMVATIAAISAMGAAFGPPSCSAIYRISVIFTSRW